MDSTYEKIHQGFLVHSRFVLGLLEYVGASGLRGCTREEGDVKGVMMYFAK